MAAAITGDRNDVTSDCFNASSYTGQRFTPTYSAFKRRDLKCREGCAPLASEKGAVEMGGGEVESFHSPQRSLVDGLVGFEYHHRTAFRWTPREGFNTCPTAVAILLIVVFLLL